jgi:hypothetical protein
MEGGPVGSVVASNWLELEDVSSISVYVVSCVSFWASGSFHLAIRRRPSFLFNRIGAIRILALRVTPIFTSKIHALISLKMGPLLRSDVMQS